MVNELLKKRLLKAQENEISEYYIYKKLAKSVKREDNRKILLSISGDEMRHYNIWKKYTGEEVSPNKFKIWKYYLISKIFGLTFGLKLMEKGEIKAQANYKKIKLSDVNKVYKDEESHEKKLINLLNEEKLKYVGSIVLGLNDALVELTGALAGLTLALQNTKIIATAGLVTGVAASLSMGASEYLSLKSEEKVDRPPFKAAVYTALTYILTVLFLIFPYLILSNIYASLIWTIINAVIVISLFSFYLSFARDLSFKSKFFEMLTISLGIAGISFGIGYLVKILIGVQI